MSKASIISAVASAVGGALVGSVVTYFVTKRKYETYFDGEIDKLRRHYALLRKEDNTIGILGQIDTPADEPVVDSTVEADEDPIEEFPGTPEQYERAKALIENLGYTPGEATEEVLVEHKTPEEYQTIFDKAVNPEVVDVGPELDGPRGKPIVKQEEPELNILKGLPDAETVLKHLGYVRYSGQPYIITQAEYYDSDESIESMSLDYYEGDDTLVDERGMVHRDQDYIVGSRHLHMFGVLSDDKNIVYVRNPKTSTDFEVLLEPGKYSVRVLGEPDYDRPEKSAPRKMRDAD